MMNKMKRTGESELPLEEWIGYRFGLIAARMGAISQSAYRKSHKLSTAAWRVLAVVARHEPCSAAVLSAHSRLDPSKVSRAIDVLVDRKLLRRTKDPEDQRRAVLTLTAQGRAMYTDIAAQVTEFENFVRSALTPAEVKKMWTIVAKLDAQVAKFPQTDFTLAESDD